MAQIQKVMKEALQIEETPEGIQGYYDKTDIALDEVKDAIDRITIGGEKSVELKPQGPKIRKLQHELIEQHSLFSESVGDGDHRHLRIVAEKALLT